MKPQKDLYLTRAGAEKLRAELQELTDVRRPELAQRLRSAIQMGDLSENAEYHAAKEEQAFLEGRVQELEILLRYATIIDENGRGDSVTIGSTVTIVEDGREPEVYTVVGAAEADPRSGLISNESPIGRALLDRKVGDTVTADTPGGTVTFRLLKIE